MQYHNWCTASPCNTDACKHVGSKLQRAAGSVLASLRRYCSRPRHCSGRCCIAVHCESSRPYLRVNSYGKLCGVITRDTARRPNQQSLFVKPTQGNAIGTCEHCASCVLWLPNNGELTAPHCTLSHLSACLGNVLTCCKRNVMQICST